MASSESYFKRRRDLAVRALSFMNGAAVGAEYSRTDMFGEDDNPELTRKWAQGLLRRLRNEGYIAMGGTLSSPRYRTLRLLELREDVISDYAATTLTGIPGIAQRMTPAPVIRFGVPTAQVVPPEPPVPPELSTGTGLRDLLTSVPTPVPTPGPIPMGPTTPDVLPPASDAAAPSITGEAVPQPTGEAAAPPTTEEMLTAFLQVLPVLVTAVNRIETRLVEMDAKLSRVYDDLTGGNAP